MKQVHCKEEKTISCAVVANALTKFMLSEYGEQASSSEALEGMLLTMMIIGEPTRSADHIRRLLTGHY